MGNLHAKRTISKTRRKTRCGWSSWLNFTVSNKDTCRDIDQIKADLLSPKHLEEWKKTKASEDLPALGQHYCTECAKWFETQTSLEDHQKGKPHKRRYAPLLTDRTPKMTSGSLLTVSPGLSSCVRNHIRREKRKLRSVSYGPRRMARLPIPQADASKTCMPFGLAPIVTGPRKGPGVALWR